MKEHNYHERLKILRLYSVQRRRERFIIILMYKILNGLVPNPGIKFRPEGRNGIMADLPLYKKGPSYVQTLRYNSFNFIGPQLFNLLPPELSNYRAPEGTQDLVSSFKNQLDKFLSKFPDEPTIQGISRQANSNSLVDQIFYMT